MADGADVDEVLDVAEVVEVAHSLTSLLHTVAALDSVSLITTHEVGSLTGV